ncbi:acyl-CoA dehydrogenase family protein [Streptomyces polygonati]|uniref:Acyl-CoA dehydrogenase family protein n=1 Tax=Streptomyces polygonati TaxID=1617087 RepID=A0ABV8HMV7_9ACTN
MLEQAPAGTGVAAAAKDVAAVAERFAAEGDSRRRLHPEVAEALLRGGFARHFVPTDSGGEAAGFQELTGAVATIGEVCAATAWCASLAANLARMAAFLPAEGYREIWAGGPDVLVVGSLAPVGRAQPEAGGWRLTGQWPYISAVDFSDWALVCAMVPTGGGRPEAKCFAVPRSAYSVVETWNSVGMRATGSNHLVVDDVFVPAARTFDRADLLAGRPVDATAACHTVPLEAANGLSFAAPVLGAARGALAAWSEHIGAKVRAAASRPNAPGPSRNWYALALARSSGEIDAAQLLVQRVAEVADLGAAGTPMTTTRNLRDCAFAVETLVTAVNRLYQTAGTTGQASAGPLERVWRDVNSASSHVALQFEPAANAYAGRRLWAS